MQTQVIQKLDEQVINKIAAGEVIERPSSILKELLDNSIDANAKNIIVSLAKGGIELVQVSDDGDGINKDQLSNVFIRHATSKIRTFEDLINHYGLGFRGEAMAAIASIAEIEIVSKPQDQNASFKITSDGEIKLCQGNNGTIVKVSHVFSKVPARLKFLKSEQSEYRACLKTFEEYAFANPKINFKLTHNQKIIYDLKAIDLKSRLQDLFGFKTLDSCKYFESKAADFTIFGFLGLPEIAKDRQNYQYLSINGRTLQASMVNHIVKKAYGNKIFPSQKPAFFIHIEMPAHHIDMNVHPRKLEAKFLMPQNVFKRIYQVVDHNLSKQDLSLNFLKTDFAEKKFPESVKFTVNKPSFNNASNFSNSCNRESFLTSNPAQNRSLDFGSKLKPLQADTKNLELKNPSPLRVLAQLKKSYILAENEEGLVLIDQHAAHEKIMYKSIKDHFKATDKKMQDLLVPKRLELSSSELELLKANLDIVAKIGIEIEFFGGNSLVIRSIATHFNKVEVEVLLQGILNDLSEFKGDSINEIEEIAINYAACRGAIKFGQALTTPEMQALLDQLEAIKDMQYSCPHGRPTQLKLSMHELDKLFLRLK
jgi:DNA mismatch repair protein MutL